MAETTFAPLSQARILVGPARTRIRGLAEEGYTLTPGGDEGGVQRGCQGDTMMYTAEMNDYELAISSNVASGSIDVILGLAVLGAPTPIEVDDGRFSLTGFFVLQNRGAVQRGLSPSSRVLTLRIVKTAGVADVGVGSILQAN